MEDLKSNCEKSMKILFSEKEFKRKLYNYYIKLSYARI